jgi:hypothetical protein
LGIWLSLGLDALFEFGGAASPVRIGTSERTATAALYGRAVLNGAPHT